MRRRLDSRVPRIEQRPRALDLQLEAEPVEALTERWFPRRLAEDLLTYQAAHVEGEEADEQQHFQSAVALSWLYPDMQLPPAILRYIQGQDDTTREVQGLAADVLAGHELSYDQCYFLSRYVSVFSGLPQPQPVSAPAQGLTGRLRAMVSKPTVPPPFEQNLRKVFMTQRQFSMGAEHLLQFSAAALLSFPDLQDHIRGLAQEEGEEQLYQSVTASRSSGTPIYRPYELLARFRLLFPERDFTTMRDDTLEAWYHIAEERGNSLRSVESVDASNARAFRQILFQQSYLCAVFGGKPQVGPDHRVHVGAAAVSVAPRSLPSRDAL